MEVGSEVAQRILRAARELLFVRGYSGTSLRAIAIAAGTSESGIFRIYGSKQGLLRAVYGSCWEEINTRVEKAVAVAAAQDPDPRNLLLKLMRAALEGFQADLPMMRFVLSHFCYSETCGLIPLDDCNPAICERAEGEYHRYLLRIGDLCREVVKTRPEFARAGIDEATLAFILISLIHGVQTGWYVSALERNSPLRDISVDETLKAAKVLLYRPEGAC